MPGKAGFRSLKSTARTGVVGVVQFIAQLALLWAVNWSGHRLVESLSVRLPGNAAAVMLMFALLQSGLVPMSWVELASTQLLRHIALFFLPIAVGLMTFGTLWKSSGISIFLTLLVSAAVGFAVTGQVCQTLARIGKIAPARPRMAPHEADVDRP